MSNYGERKSRAVGLNDKAFGGAGHNLTLDAIMGEGTMITTFDDFNGVVGQEAFGVANTIWETLGWELTDVGSPVADLVHMNDANFTAGASTFNSCITITPGTAADAGGNMQLDFDNNTTPIASGGVIFPHIWLPETRGIDYTGGANVGLDNKTAVFAFRIGFEADNNTNNTDWDAKTFIGWARSADTAVLVPTDGLIAIASTGGLFGFHFLEDGSVRGISHRTAATAMVEGTNFTEILPAGSLDNSVANGTAAEGDVIWFDFALRMEIDDMSDISNNGSTQFFYRGALNHAAGVDPARQQFSNPGEGYKPWIKHPTVLLNQTPLETSNMIVPTIEVVNGPVGTAQNCQVRLDWWAMGLSRDT